MHLGYNVCMWPASAQQRARPCTPRGHLLRGGEAALFPNNKIRRVRGNNAVNPPKPVLKYLYIWINGNGPAVEGCHCLDAPMQLSVHRWVQLLSDWRQRTVRPPSTATRPAGTVCSPARTLGCVCPTPLVPGPRCAAGRRGARRPATRAGAQITLHMAADRGWGPGLLLSRFDLH